MDCEVSRSHLTISFPHANYQHSNDYRSRYKHHSAKVSLYRQSSSPQIHITQCGAINSIKSDKLLAIPTLYVRTSRQPIFFLCRSIELGSTADPAVPGGDSPRVKPPNRRFKPRCITKPTRVSFRKPSAPESSHRAGNGPNCETVQCGNEGEMRS